MGDQNPYKQGGMFEGATNLIFENAKQLRNKMTASEMVLWMQLRAIQGFKFRSQHPIGLFIADLYCHKAKLVIEFDGSVHEKKEIKQNDVEKERFLINRGYEVIRFKNDEIHSAIDIVLNKISDKLNFIIQKQSPKIGV